MPKTVEVLIEGGKATPGPPLGPALGPLGVNVKKVVDEINEKTSHYAGMQVPASITVDDQKNFTIEIGVPPTSALIKKSSENQNISIEQAMEIAKQKMPDMLAYSLRSAVKEVLGTCISRGIRVDHRDPREIQKDIDEGKYNIK